MKLKWLEPPDPDNLATGEVGDLYVEIYFIENAPSQHCISWQLWRSYVGHRRGYILTTGRTSSVDMAKENAQAWITENLSSEGERPEDHPGLSDDYFHGLSNGEG